MGTKAPPPPMDLFPEELKRNPFLFYIKKNPRTYSLAFITLVITDILDILPPLIIGYCIDIVRKGAPLSDLVKATACLIGLIAIMAVFRYAWRIYWGRFSHFAADDLRNRLFKKFLKLGPEFYQGRPTGELMSLITNDVNSFRLGLGPGQLILVDALVLGIFIPPLMFYISPDWTWKTLILLPFLPFGVLKFMRLIHDRYEKQQASFAKLSGFVQEAVSGIRIIKGYGQEVAQLGLFNQLSRRYETLCNNAALANASFPPFMETSVAIASFVLLLVGAPEVLSGAVSLGSLFAFYQYIQRMSWPVTAVGIGLTHVQQGLASFSRLRPVMDEPISPEDEGRDELQEFRELSIRNLNYSYLGSNRLALANVNLTIKRGEVVGLTGPTGAGKSTLIELISRFREAPAGTIFINDVDIRSYKLSSLRQFLSLVPQDPFLFNDKVSENLCFGSDTSLSESQQRGLLQLVQLEEEIERLPGRFDAYLGERGLNLSGGQRQRLTIARALGRSATLLILDDSLCSVDAHTEAQILGALKTLKRFENKLTLLFISHRISSLDWCDRIVVLNEGRIEAEGNHEELNFKSETYRKLRSAGKANERNLLVVEKEGRLS